jgi:hypothetical protein
MRLSHRYRSSCSETRPVVILTNSHRSHMCVSDRSLRHGETIRQGCEHATSEHVLNKQHGANMCAIPAANWAQAEPFSSHINSTRKGVWVVMGISLEQAYHLVGTLGRIRMQSINWSLSTRRSLSGQKLRTTGQGGCFIIEILRAASAKHFGRTERSAVNGFSQPLCSGSHMHARPAHRSASLLRASSGARLDDCLYSSLCGLHEARILFKRNRPEVLGLPLAAGQL